ncbi:MAG TPA: glycoside hydrolase [Rectinemataceae bacterium]|nr:glycoside hydrolase [Rectinemataceae bacterium]
MKRSDEPYEIFLSDTPAATIPWDYLSLTIDSSLVVGGHWWSDAHGLSRGVATETVPSLDFRNLRLLAFAAQLAPAMLRVGGTEADRIGYRIKTGHSTEKCEEPAVAPESAGHEFVMKKRLWKEIIGFVRAVDYKLLFVVSAGPADRDAEGRWLAGNAHRLIEYSARKGFPVRAWELGNEVNGYPFVHGFRNRVSARRYTEDFRLFSNLVLSLHPGARAVGPASSVWPLFGEPNPIIPTLARSGAMLPTDVLSWHYYPQQSRRGRIADRRASALTLMRPSRLDSARIRARRIVRAAGGREVWMTETGHALYGGEPGLSDTHCSSLWWLDQLGLLAQEGIQRVFRQALIGSDYGLLDQDSFLPRPDYYASLLWKRLMGTTVIAAPRVAGPDRLVRAYLHSFAEDPRKSCLLLINLRGRPTRIWPVAPGATPPQPAAARPSARIAERYVIQGMDGLCSDRIALNGVEVGEDLALEWGKKRTRRKYGLGGGRPAGGAAAGGAGGPEALEMPPYSYAFLVLA